MFKLFDKKLLPKIGRFFAAVWSHPKILRPESCSSDYDKNLMTPKRKGEGVDCYRELKNILRLYLVLNDLKKEKLNKYQ